MDWDKGLLLLAVLGVVEASLSAEPEPKPGWNWAVCKRHRQSRAALIQPCYFSRRLTHSLGVRLLDLCNASRASSRVESRESVQTVDSHLSF